MPAHWLREDVYCCASGHLCIWLDVHKDRYFATDLNATQRLAAVISNLKLGDYSALVEESPREGDSEVLETLFSNGLLTEDRAKARGLINRAEPVATRTLESSSPTRIRPLHILLCMLSVLITKFVFRRVSLAAALKMVSPRRRTSIEITASDEPRIGRLVGAFMSLRHVFYMPKDECLFDSIVLTRYLMWFGIKPTLMIGVSTDPFRAHCWVQIGDTALNGDADLLAAFTPIFTSKGQS